MPAPGALARPWLRGRKPLASERERPEIPPELAAMADIAGAVQTAQRQATSLFYPQHRQWAINHAMYLGNQYATWSEQHRRLLNDGRVPEYRVRIAVNTILPIVQTIAAMLVQSRPQPIVVPATSQNDDMNKARAAERILDYIRQDQRLDSRELAAAVVMLVKSCVFAKVLWDPDAGPWQSAVDEETGQPLTDPETGAPMIDPATYQPLRFQMGRVVTEFWYPESVLPDPSARRFEDVGWIVHTVRRPVPWIRRRYDFGRYVTNEAERADQSETLESMMNGVTAGGYLSEATLGQMTPTEGARVNELWLRPGATFANKVWRHGALITQCQGFADVRPLEYLDCPGADPDRDWHPFVMWRGLESGRFWPLAIPDNLSSLQREINRIVSSIIEHARLMARPKYLIPNLCNVAKSALTSEPAEKVYYNHVGGAKPEVMEMPDLPAFMPNILSYLQQQIDFVSNQHSASRGEAPPGVKSGIGFSLLQEQDAKDMGPLSLNMEEFQAGCARQHLLRVRQYWHLPRTVNVVGKDKQIESATFMGADVGDYIDVRVQPGSGLPKSKAAQQALVRELVELGLYLPIVPRHRRVLMQLLELGVGDDYGRDEEKDRRLARHENELMLKGIIPKVEWFQDHTAHLEELLDFMKGDQYREAVAKNPMVEVLFNLHAAGHASPQNLAAMQMNPASGGQLLGGMGGPGMMGMGGPGAGAPGETSQNGKLGRVGEVQGQKANRVQSMGGQNAVAGNPSMGA